MGEGTNSADLAQELSLAGSASDAQPGAIPYSVDDVRAELARVKRRRRLKVVLVIVAVLLVALLVAGIASLGSSSSFKGISDGSMEPVLSEGQIVHVAKEDSITSDMVISYLDSSGVERVGRVIAVSDEWVNAVSDGTVVITDTPLSDASAQGVITQGASVLGSRQVPSGGFCVIGDADDESQRVMSGIDAFIRGGQVIGRVDAVVWPIWEAGEVR